jgi:tetratricopeptide (TPR) repeat protein
VFHPVRIAAALYVLLAAACTQIPLVRTPGFEFAFVCAAAGSLIAGMLTVSVVKPAYRAEHAYAEEQQGSLRKQVRRVMTLNLLLPGIPFTAIFISGLFAPLCDPLEGVAFFLLLPVISVFFSVSLAVFCAVHYRFSKTMFLSAMAVSGIHAAALGYFTPAIFSYNFFYGYFPGLSYDELLPLNVTLVLFRTLTLLAGAALLWLSGLLVRYTHAGDTTKQKGARLLRALVARRHLPVTLTIALVTATVVLFRCELGFESTAAFIQKTLGSRCETEHFVIYYNAASEPDVRLLAAAHEFHLRSVLETFALPQTERIGSYVYPSADSKRRLMGAGTTEIAKPWNREVHITRQSVNGTLRHELVHVVAGPFGVPVLRASLSLGLVEGLAMAVDGRWGYRTLHQYAAAIRATGIARDIQLMMSTTGFVQQSSSVSYVLAGSFCRFLIDTYGISPLMFVYGSGKYEEACRQPLSDLVASWNRFLDGVAVGESERASVDVFFRQPSILGKTCPHLVAKRLREARRLVAGRHYEEAAERYTAILTTAGGYDALAGVLLCRLRTGAYRAVTSLYDSVVTRDNVPLRYLPLALTAGDAAWADGDTTRARRLFVLVRRYDVAPYLTEAAAVRLWALDISGHAPEFARYFLIDADDSTRIQRLAAIPRADDGKLRDFLTGRVYLRLRRFQDALSTMVDAGPCRDAVLEAARRVTIGEALEGLGRYQEAKTWYRSLLNTNTRDRDVADVADRAAWCDWCSRGITI